MIASQGSGERLDRDAWLQANEAVQSRRYDLVIAEDLGRIARRMHVFLFCEEAQDYDTRVITINDHVDTGRAGWKLSAVFSSLHHEQSNEDTSLRIRRSLRNIFVNGGAVQCEIYGYVKPPGTSTDDELAKDPAAEPVYERWFEHASRSLPSPLCRMLDLVAREIVQVLKQRQQAVEMPPSAPPPENADGR